MIESLHFILPELILAGGAMFVLMLGALTNNSSSLIITTRVSSFILLGAFLTTIPL